MTLRFIKRSIIWIKTAGTRLDVKSRIINAALNNRRRVSYQGAQYVFAIPNRLCRYRADTFASKEPETLAWIDTFSAKSIFWDIGANVGLYSIYAAKRHGCQVFAFEPSVFNLEVLGRNVRLNDLSAHICLVPLAVSNRTGSGLLHMSSTSWGGALSTYDKTFGFDGKELNSVFEYAIFGVTLDDAVTKLGLPTPHYIKIDVDGIEHLILSGGFKVLSTVRSVLVEISRDFREQSKSSKEYLEAAGLVLQAGNRQAQESDSATTNQIWVRP